MNPGAASTGPFLLFGKALTADEILRSSEPRLPTLSYLSAFAQGIRSFMTLKRSMTMKQCTHDPAGEAMPMGPIVAGARPPFRKLSKRVQFQGLTMELADLEGNLGSSPNLSSSRRAKAFCHPASPPHAPVIQ